MTVIYELSRSHQRAGGETEVIVGRGTRHDYPVGHCREVDYVPLPSWDRRLMDAALGALCLPRVSSQSVYKAACHAISRDFDGVIFLYNAAFAVPVLRKHAPKAKICLYCHNDLFRTYRRREVRRVVACTDCIIAVSHYIADRILAALRGNDSRIVVIHNGADTEQFYPTLDPSRDSMPVVLFVGRVQPFKGPDLLIKAARKIHGPHRRFKLRVVGSQGFSATDQVTSYERSLRALARPMGDAVEFQPFVDRNKLLSVYQAADIFCAPSNWDDPCPLTIPEAMACGLPVVTSRRGGIPEQGGETVLYFDPPDVNGLARQLARLLDDLPLRHRLGEQARERSEAFDWKKQYCMLRDHLATIRGGPFLAYEGPVRKETSA